MWLAQSLRAEERSRPTAGEAIVGSGSVSRRSGDVGVSLLCSPARSGKVAVSMALVMRCSVFCASVGASSLQSAVSETLWNALTGQGQACRS